MSIYITVKTRSDKSRVTSEEFLTWAQQDIKGGNNRGIANALTNAKRALHARIDEILYSVRVRYANDWPDIPNTDTKLNVLKHINIITTDIANVLTNRRNDLEHRYILPPLAQVRADVQTCCLWLDSLKSHFTTQIVIAGLPIKSCVQSPYVRTKKKKLNITIDSTQKILFFCDNKRKLIILKSDGTRNETSYNKFKWKELIKYQQPFLRDKNSLAITSMSVASKIYSEYEHLVNRNKRGVIILFDQIMLEESDVRYDE
jgi:hypothetical protein